AGAVMALRRLPIDFSPFGPLVPVHLLDLGGITRPAEQRVAERYLLLYGGVPLMGKARRLLARLGLAAMLLVSTGTCGSLASDVVVHLISARTGAPIAKKPVVLLAWYGLPPKQHLEQLRKRTDSHGTAVFTLEDPLPSWLAADIA